MNDVLSLVLFPKEGSMLVDRNVIEALGKPRQIQLQINEEMHMLVLRTCTTEDREAVIIPEMHDPGFEMSGISLIKRIRRLTKWSDDEPKIVYGWYVDRFDAVIFDLNTAETTELQNPIDKNALN